MTNKQVTINLLSSHQLQEQMKPEEIETIFHGKPTDADILTVVTKQGIRHFCDEVEFVTDGEQPVQDGTEPFNTDGLRWHPMSDPMLPWHTCLLVHEKSYCIVRRHDDGRMFEITNNIEIKDGDPFHLIKWIDLGDIAKR